MSFGEQGMSHSPSDEIMRDVRYLAVEFVNKRGLLEMAQRLIKTLCEAFAEMEPITQILDKDVSTLDGIAVKVDVAEDRGSHTHASESSAHAVGTRTAQPPSPKKGRPWGCLLFLLLFVVVLIAGYIAAIFT